eukprot:CAMPEP_0202978440 /NCGR_PEP_ID=MMETSP1396-20130829/84859_1 /ASSEMBLY_ACC=CAM_ASM_000872 /TAXON_ID= /ORGANISM="Pseudokeronopsis sp., Strain Brazil" /LENGTH=65 /DNA_ID=CAMNT_0049717405 /DNA_START=1899 /DNA_END=2096 /DNA_ORIENTATION=-
MRRSLEPKPMAPRENSSSFLDPNFLIVHVAEERAESKQNLVLKSEQLKNYFSQEYCSVLRQEFTN